MKAEKIFKLAKGFRGRAKNTIRIARNRVEKALQYSYRDRKAKKRDFRGLWIQQINAGVREHGIGYGEFISGLKDENIQLNRKMLAEIAQTEPYSFKALVDTVKRMRGYPVDPPKAGGGFGACVRAKPGGEKVPASGASEGRGRGYPRRAMSP